MFIVMPSIFNSTDINVIFEQILAFDLIKIFSTLQKNSGKECRNSLANLSAQKFRRNLMTCLLYVYDSKERVSLLGCKWTWLSNSSSKTFCKKKSYLWIRLLSIQIYSLTNMFRFLEKQCFSQACVVRYYGESALSATSKTFMRTWLSALHSFHSWTHNLWTKLEYQYLEFYNPRLFMSRILFWSTCIWKRTIDYICFQQVKNHVYRIITLKVVLCLMCSVPKNAIYAS